VLLASEAQVDLKKENGSAPLTLASMSGHSEIVQILLASGAQVDLQKEDGLSALML